MFLYRKEMLQILFLCFIVALLLACNWLLVYIRNKNRARMKENPVQVIGRCDSPAVLQAYITGLIAPPSCPAYSNNLVVDSAYHLQERAVVHDDDGCCYFNDAERKPVPAQICVSMLDPSGLFFSLQALNQNPYTKNGGLSYSFTKPGEYFGLAKPGEGVYLGNHPKFTPLAVPFDTSCRIPGSWNPGNNEFGRIVKDLAWMPLPAEL